MRLQKKMLSLLCAASMLLTALTGCGGGSAGSSTESGSPDANPGAADASSADSSSEGGESKAADGSYTVALADVAEAMGAGWNYGNTLEAVSSDGAVSETAWGNPEASQAMIDAVAAAGFKSIRVPVTYVDKIDDSNDYKVDEAWLNRVEEVVNYCYNQDLFVIINMHGDGYNSIPGGWFLCNGEDQDYIKEKYQAAWQQIAEKFADYDEHLIFESMNEEFDGEYHDPVPEYYQNINDYNQIFVDTVRASGGNNTHRWLLMPGWNTDITYTVGNYGFELPKDDNNTAGEGRMMVSVHYYNPWDYAGDEKKNRVFLWGDQGEAVVNAKAAPRASIANYGDQKQLEEQFGQLKSKFVDNGVPVVIGEYGCIDKSQAEPVLADVITHNRAYFDAYVAGTAASMGMIPVYWDNGFNGTNGFGLFDRNKVEQTQPELIEAIVKAVADKSPMTDIITDIEASAVEAPSEVHAYIGVQTKAYTFRNGYSDNDYGAETEYFNTLIKWEDTDGDGNDDITDSGAVFEDAAISEDGTYTVSVSGYDFAADSDGLNMLFVSTDFPYSGKLRIKDIVIKYDDQEFPVEHPNISTDGAGNTYIELVNIYNTELTPPEMDMPKDSISVQFTVSGVKNVVGDNAA